MLHDFYHLLYWTTQGFRKNVWILLWVLCSATGISAQSAHFLHLDKSETVFALDEITSIVIKKKVPLEVKLVDKAAVTFAYDEFSRIFFSAPSTGFSNEPSLHFGYQIFPNPVEDVLNIYSPENSPAIHRIELVSLAGVFVYTESFDIERRKIELPVAGLQPGLYLCRIKAGDAWKTIKFNKQ